MFINIIGIIIGGISVGIIDVIFCLLVFISNFILCYTSAHYEKICCCSEQKFITPYN